jgi:hypothetical protein
MQLSQLQTMTIIHTGTALSILTMESIPKGTPVEFEFIEDQGNKFYHVFTAMIDILIDVVTFVTHFSIMSLFIHD